MHQTMEKRIRPTQVYLWCLNFFGGADWEKNYSGCPKTLVKQVTKASKILWWTPSGQDSFWMGNKITNTYGAFTLDVKSVLNENLGGVLGGMQC
jgi:hypothetical protein